VKIPRHKRVCRREAAVWTTFVAEVRTSSIVVGWPGGYHTRLRWPFRPSIKRQGIQDDHLNEPPAVGHTRNRVHTSDIGPGYSLLVVLIPESDLAGLAQIAFDRLRNRIADPAVCAEQYCLISASLSGTRSTVALTRFARACGFCRLADRGALATAGVSKTGWVRKSEELRAKATGTRIGHGVPGCAYST
jgi:hypothetical protein